MLLYLLGLRPDPGRSIAKNKASLNTFVLDILNMLHYYRGNDCFMPENEF